MKSLRDRIYDLYDLSPEERAWADQLAANDADARRHSNDRRRALAHLQEVARTTVADRVRKATGLDLDIEWSEA